MQIAFYAPLKPPDHPVPSGDRRVARLLIEALNRGDHRVTLASRLRSRDAAGDPERQRRLARLGARLAARLIRGYRRNPTSRPDLWLTYHLYYKAPDWIGPCVAETLGIPYVVVEVSAADKRLQGPWMAGERAIRAALGRADAVIGLSSADREGVMPLLADVTRWNALAPFLDRAPFEAAIAQRVAIRAELARSFSLDPREPWLVAVAMMRDDVKRHSYRLLGRALARLRDRRYSLLVLGDGPARQEVEAGFAPLLHKVRFLGALAERRVAETLAASDLFAWPALGEAYGMALLEAQAAGLPVVAGEIGGVGDIVANGITGLLVPPADEAAFADAVAALLDNEPLRVRFGTAARQKVAAAHDLGTAARRLDEIVRALARANVP